MKKLFTDLGIGLILILGGFGLGYAFSQTEVMNRYSKVMKKDKGNFDIDSVNYIVHGKSLTDK